MSISETDPVKGVSDGTLMCKQSPRLERLDTGDIGWEINNVDGRFSSALLSLLAC